MQNNPDNFCNAQDAKKYQAIKNRLFVFNLIFNILFLFFFVFLGYSNCLKAWITASVGNFFLINAFYFFIFSLIIFCLSLPFEIYEGYILEHSFKLSRQTFMGWLKDVLKKSIITFIVCLVLVEAIYFFLLKFSYNWWAAAAFFWFFISVILARITPKILLPIFFRYKPLENTELRDRLQKFLARFKVKLKDIYVLDFSKKTVKANAMVAGLGKTKQIFLSDTLVAEFAPEEIEVVLAHEVGHYLNKDILKIMLLGLCSTLVCFFSVSVVFEKLILKFGFSAISDIVAFPILLLILMLCGLILLPVQNGFSRFLEKKADIFALKATENPVAFISMMKHLGERNLSEFSPSKIVEIFLYGHPPLSKRIKLAQSFNKLNPFGESFE